MELNLTEWASHCGIAFMSQRPLIMTLFMGGLVGSATHCAGMCGPFVISQTAARLQPVPLQQLTEWRRLRGAALLPYHCGRLTTYVLLGMSAAGLAAPLRTLWWFHYVAMVLLLGAGVMFLLQALRQVSPLLAHAFKLRPLRGLSAPRFIQPVMQRLFAAPTGWRGYALGLMLGLLPCGLIYAALMAVTARGDPLVAALGMAAFALGTIPALVLVGVGGQYVAGRWPQVMRYGAPLIMSMNAVVLFIMAGGYWR